MKRLERSNNKYSGTYDETLPSKYIYYVDANNLYGYAMCKPLPFGNFQWLTEAELDTLDVSTIREDSDVGYIMEVDLAYPDELHDMHKDLPFCAEMKCPPGGRYSKLLTTLQPKVNYVAHHTIVQQAIENGLRIVKLHRAIKFNQSPWMKPYIELNTQLRQASQNDFEKNFFKLMNNAVFGKTMENVRKRIDIRLVSSGAKAVKLISKCNFVDRKVFGENLVAIHLQKAKLIFNKATYVGMSILEMSKVCMYNFHHAVIKPYYGNRVELCYMDTDSFVYSITTDDLYSDMNDYMDHLDTSNYPPTHPLRSLRNKMVLGKFKDETNGDNIALFVGLRAKMYAMRYDNECEIKKLKGIKKAVIQDELTVEDYITCLQSNVTTYSRNRSFRSYNHVIHSICMNKVTLDTKDDKRHIMEDGVSTLPHGHYKTKKRAREEE